MRLEFLYGTEEWPGRSHTRVVMMGLVLTNFGGSERVVEACLTFASVIPSCSFTFARVIPTLFKVFFVKTFFVLLVSVFLITCRLYFDSSFFVKIL